MAYVALLVALGASVGLALVFRGVVQATNSVRAYLAAQPRHKLDKRVTKLEELVDALPVKWEEMLKHAQRSESRVRAVVRRARQEFAENGLLSPETEAAAEELRDGDGETGDVEQLLALRRAVEANQGQAEPDWEQVTRLAKFGG